MRRRLTILLLTCHLAAVAAAADEHGDRGLGLYLLPGMQLIDKDSDRDINSRATASLGLGVAVSRRLDLELHGSYGETGLRGPGGADVAVVRARLDGLYRLGSGAIEPYVVAGLHHDRFRISGAANDSGSGISLGAGVRRGISSRWSAQVDVRAQFDVDESRFQPAATLALRYQLRPDPEPAIARPERVAPAEAPPAPREPEPRVVEDDEPIRLELRFEFDFDSDTVRSEHRDGLDRIIRFMQARPDARARLVGHTDNRGPEAYNQGLSERRARSVRDHLLAAGIDGARITIEGRGEHEPVASNATEAGRQRNRRVVAITVATGTED